jgi:NAD(P)H-flavin reductase
VRPGWRTRRPAIPSQDGRGGRGHRCSTYDILRLRLRVDGRALHFSPGQYVTLHLPGRPPHDYSMASLPGTRELDFHIRRVPGGRSSAAIHDRLQLDQILCLIGARGAVARRSRRRLWRRSVVDSLSLIL